MKLTDVSLSLLVAFAPAANRCDPTGRAAPAAAADNAQSTESPPAAESPPALPGARAPDGVLASENAAVPESLVASDTPAAENPPPPENTGSSVDDNASGSAAAGEPPAPGFEPAPPPMQAVPRGLARGAEPLAPETETAAPPEPAGEFAPGQYAVGDDGSGYDDADPSALTDFHNALDPYGTWTDDPAAGTVWVPSADAVGADFRPYVTAGQWTYDTDWIWASDYVWGWAPFHYGRWLFLRGRGWSWVPGRTYRGAWVLWSVDPANSYVGWAPIAPQFVWVGGVAVAWQPTQVHPHWTCCPRSSVFAASLATRVLVGPAAAPLLSRMRVLEGPTGAPTTGPSPGQLGYSTAQILRPSGAVAVSLTRAVQFARPSTALALGARPPSQLSRSAPPAAPTGAGNNAPAAGFLDAPTGPQSGSGAALSAGYTGGSGHGALHPEPGRSGGGRRR
jgi:hypothetical protein